MKELDRCTTKNALGKRCILEHLHYGPHEDVAAVKWGDAPQCPVFLPNGTRCLRKYGHELNHKMYTGVDFVEFSDEEVAEAMDRVIQNGDYREEYQAASNDSAIISLPPQSLARRLWHILDCADERPFVPISQKLIQEIIIALPKEYL